MRVLHVKGRNLVEINPPYEFLNGDVYVIDNSDVSAGLAKKVFIWLGSQAFADDRAVGAWAAKQLDLKDKEIDIDTEVEGNESAEFKQLLDFVVVTGDTPGFLKHVEVNVEDISYALYRVRDVDLADGSSSDDIVIENVPLKRDSFKSEDVFVLDAYHDLYVWVGSSSQVGEKAAGNRLVRKLDVDRERTPMIYSIGEGYEPEGFFDLIDQLAESGQVRADAAEISEGITGTIADIKAPGTPPSELSPPPPSGMPEVTPSPVSVPKPPTPVEERPEPTTADLGLEAAPAVAPVTRAGIIKLYYNHDLREFTEKGDQDEAVLEINEGAKTATLIFAEGSGLILQRTAARQARGICKSGFQLKAGYRVGLNCELREVKGERSIDDRLLQEGHHYR
ncbi:MAG: hypothetical protein ACFFDT_14145 [Candidatus Hodarchaeota archaeon]